MEEKLSNYHPSEIKHKLLTWKLPQVEFIDKILNETIVSELPKQTQFVSYKKH